MQRQPSDHDARLVRVFGEVLPGSTTDDRPDHEDSSSDERDRWLRDNRPPHHDGSV
ncbi:MAG TPA: hypothetical protein VGJ13_08145 [Pseudonocardiaceae bacterium]